MISAETRTADQERELYIERIEELYAQVGSWLRDFDPAAHVTRSEVSIREAPIGEYPAPVLCIERTGRAAVRLVPRGCNIIGAEGRVDMKSDLGTETLVYLGKEAPSVRIELITEGGRVLGVKEPEAGLDAHGIGWVLVQDRQLALMPTLDASLCCRLIEVLGR